MPRALTPAQRRFLRRYPKPEPPPEMTVPPIPVVYRTTDAEQKPIKPIDNDSGR